MKTKGTVPLAILVSLLLAACGGGVAEGDRVACETFADGHNSMMRAVYDGSEANFVRSMTAAQINDIPDALLVVEDPELKIALSNAADMSQGLQGSDQDVSTAYFLYAYDIFETCQDLGVDVKEVADEADSP